MASEKNDILEQKKNSHEIAADSLQFLSFMVGNETYGVNIMTVQEIKGWSETTNLPQTPEYMRGVLNLRGIVIPILDLRSRFSMGETAVDASKVVIVLTAGNRTIGILVDSVSDILTVTPDEIKPSPTIDTKIDEEFIDGLLSIENRMVILLNVGKLFNNKTLDAAEHAASNHLPN